MKWHFPLINPLKKFSLSHYIEHVYEELEEFEDEKDGTINQAKEVIDILHSAETLVRKYFLKYPEFDFESMKREIIDKNKKRGYYIE